MYSLVLFGDPTIENGQTTPSQSVYLRNDTIYFSCDYGYSLSGSNTSTCQSSGQWKPQFPSCISGNTGQACVIQTQLIRSSTTSK